MLLARLFQNQADVIWVPQLSAFVHTRLQMGVDLDAIEEDLAEALFWGELALEETAIAAFCADYFDLAGDLFSVMFDASGLWRRVEE
jgi:hypothetical protein